MRKVTSMFMGVTLSTANYDALLKDWSQQDLQHNTTFDVGNSRYSSDAKAARDKLINDFSWTIRDGGQE